MKRFLKIGLIFTLLFTFHVNNIYAEEVEGTPDPTQENSLEEEVEEETFVPMEGDRNLNEIRLNNQSTPLLQANGDYGVTYEANGGNGSMESETYHSEHNTYMFPECTITPPEGTSFSHWDVNGSRYQPGDTLVLTGSIIVKPIWNRIQLRAPLRAGGTGKIRLAFGWVAPDGWRNNKQFPRGASMGWVSLPYYSNGAAELLDSSGNVVESYTGEAEHVFTNLAPGTYTIRISLLDSGNYEIVESIVNGSSGRPDHLITTYESTVEVPDGSSAEILRWVVVEYKAFGFKTTTTIGTFENGTQVKDYYPNTKDGKRNWSYPNTDPSRVDTNPTFNTHSGIFYNDSASLYSGMGKLEVPTLSAEEEAKGYTFEGWKLQGDPSGKIYSEEEVLAYKVTSDVVFEAVWDIPEHTVTFGTNEEYGLIDGQPYYSYTKQFNNQKVDDIPTVTPKQGYEFIGWFTDLTTNVIPESTIRNTDVNKDLNYYAKYRKQTIKHTVKYLPGSDGSLQGTDTILVKDESFIPTIPTVVPNDGATFTGKWKVVAISDDTDIHVGDVMNEIQISRLQVTYDINLEAQYEKQAYTVTYKDGANNTVFMPVVHENLSKGTITPTFGSDPTRSGYRFLGWSPTVASTVTADVTYIARWEKISVDPTPSSTNKPTSSNTTIVYNITNGRTNVPNTGDNTQIVLWIGLLVGSVVIIGGLFYFLKKKR